MKVIWPWCYYPYDLYNYFINRATRLPRKYHSSWWYDHYHCTGSYISFLIICNSILIKNNILPIFHLSPHIQILINEFLSFFVFCKQNIEFRDMKDEQNMCPGTNRCRTNENMMINFTVWCWSDYMVWVSLDKMNMPWKIDIFMFDNSPSHSNTAFIQSF